MTSVAAQLHHAWQIFETGVPLLHLCALYCTLPAGGSRLKKATIALRYPFAGGARTLVFQSLSWVLFAVSLLLALAPGNARRLGNNVDDSQEDLVMALAAFSAAISLLFMCKSFLLFDPQHPLPAGRLWRGMQHGEAALYWDLSRMPSKLAASYIVVGLGVLWSILGAALLMAPRMSLIASNGALGVAMRAFSGICFTIAAFTTHGLGGRLRYQHLMETSGNSGEGDGEGEGNGNVPPSPRKPATPTASESAPVWRFFQPFRGGPVFIATQAAGWLLFSTALGLVLWGVAEAGLGVAHFLRSWALAAGTTGVAAELLLATSLLTYNARGMTVADVKRSRHALRSAASHAAIMTLLYVPMHVVIATFLLSFLALPVVYAGSLWIGGLTIYYSITGFAEAEHTGHREWPAFQNWVGREVERVLPSWLGSFEVKVQPGAVFDPEKRYVFAYLPHGLYPLAAAYLPHTSAFRKAVCNVRPVTLTASVVFQLPFLRDILLWIGARTVRRNTFVRALRQRGAVLVVPGGQRELVEAHRMTDKKDAVAAVYTGHKGFVRLAIQEGACLVPLVVLGEVTSMRNIIKAPKAQLWTYKVLGFPVPFLIGGLANILPLPSRVGLRFVVGAPIEPPTIAAGEDPTEEQVAALHRKFYDAAEKLWAEHSKDFPGYERIPMVRL